MRFAKLALLPVLTFAMTQGVWGASTGQMGTLTTAEITAVQAVVSGAATAARKPCKSFAVFHNLCGPNAADTRY